MEASPAKPPKPPKPAKPPKSVVGNSSPPADQKSGSNVPLPPASSSSPLPPPLSPPPPPPQPPQPPSTMKPPAPGRSSAASTMIVENPIKKAGKTKAECEITAAMRGSERSTSPLPYSVIKQYSDRERTIRIGGKSERSALFSMLSESTAESFRFRLDFEDCRFMQDLNVIRYGEMMKMNREGKFERNKFFLTHDKLIYSKTVPVIASETSADDSAGTTAQDTEKTSPDKATDSTGTSQTSRKELDLSTVLVMDLDSADHRVLVKEEKWPRTFKILSKQKSFFVRAPSEELKREWFEEIKLTASSLQERMRGSCVKESELAPIWSTNHTHCQLCDKKFSFFARKHHCRNCGKCVCELCSREMVRIPKIDEWKLFKVCNPCAKEIKETRVYGADSRRGGSSS